jgi:hypothetical protein
MPNPEKQPHQPARARTFWREHEEGLLYGIAAAVYIPAGVFLKTILLNWIVGISFPFVVVYLIPMLVRKRLQRRTQRVEVTS